MPAPKVYIVILNFNQWQDSRDCIESVLRSAYTHYSVFLIDNNSGNNSIEHLAAWLDNLNDNEISLTGKPVDYSVMKSSDLNASADPSGLATINFIQNETNDGFAAGNNGALQFLKEQDAYIWLLNPDMTIQEDSLSELVQFITRKPPGSIAGAVVRSYKDKRKVLFYGGGRINFLTATVRMAGGPGEVPNLDYISGGCLFTHAATFKNLGLLPEEYFLYWEETEWCYRAKQSGSGLYVCASAVCYDKISTVIGKSFMSDYYYVRNGLLFISKYRKKNIPFVLFFLWIRFMKRIVTGRWARARGVFKGTMDFLKMKRDESK